MGASNPKIPPRTPQSWHRPPRPRLHPKAVLLWRLLSRTLGPAELGARRQPWACLAGLLSGWTPLFSTVWLAAFFAFFGGVSSFLFVSLMTRQYGQAAQPLDFAAFFGGAGAGFLAAFAVFFGTSLTTAFNHVLLSLVVGAVSALVITWVALLFEPLSLDLRGYRRPSRLPAEASVVRTLDLVALEMGLGALPELRVCDSTMPAAWTHSHSIVVTKGLINQMSSEELAAILAHELHHWHAGDPVAQRVVWACAFPIVMLQNLREGLVSGSWGGEPSSPKQPGKAGLIVAAIRALLWPAPVLLNFFVVPVMTSAMRRQEFEADAAAIAAGGGPALASALRKLSQFECARTGWEAALLRTHPPTEFRLEAIAEAEAQAA